MIQIFFNILYPVSFGDFLAAGLLLYLMLVTSELMHKSRTLTNMTIEQCGKKTLISNSAVCKITLAPNDLDKEATHMEVLYLLF